MQDSSGIWSFIWEEMAGGNDVPFSPRAGLGKKALPSTTNLQPDVFFFRPFSVFGLSSCCGWLRSALSEYKSKAVFCRSFR